MILLELFWTFFRISAFTFGGGYAMLPLIQEAVLAKPWGISEELLINFIAVSESTPGPFAINMATYIGATQAGVLGSIFATLGVVMPSFLVILIVAKCYDRFRKSRIVQGCMSGLKPAVVGLIGAAILSVAMEVLLPAGLAVAFTNPHTYVLLGIFVLTLVLAFKKVNSIILIGISAVIGIVAGYLMEGL